MKLSSIRVDSAKIESGVWIEAGDYDSRLRGVRLCLRGFGSKDDLIIVERQNRKARRQQSLDVARANMTERLVGAILVDWSGIDDDAERPIPFSKEEARRYIDDPDYGVFRAVVVQAASDIAEGDAADLKADAGN